MAVGAHASLPFARVGVVSAAWPPWAWSHVDAAPSKPPAGPAARPQPPVLSVSCGAGWRPVARGALGTPGGVLARVGGARGAGRRQARAPAGVEWHGVGGRGRWKRPFDFPILENAPSGEGIVAFTLHLGPELVIQDLCYRPRAGVWQGRRREPSLVEGLGSCLRFGLDGRSRLRWLEARGYWTGKAPSLQELTTTGMKVAKPLRVFTRESTPQPRAREHGACNALWL